MTAMLNPTLLIGNERTFFLDNERALFVDSAVVSTYLPFRAAPRLLIISLKSARSALSPNAPYENKTYHRKNKKARFVSSPQQF